MTDRETRPDAGTGSSSLRENAQREGSLGLLLCEHIWNDHRILVLAGEEYTVISGEEVPGYENDDFAVLLRRVKDGEVFEADIDVTIQPARKPAAPAAKPFIPTRLGGF